MLGGNSPVDCIGRGGAPVELKVLGVLRILGRATCFDGITELSGIPTSSMQALSHRFTAWFPKDIYPEFVYAPKTREDLARVELPTRWWACRAASGPWTLSTLRGACVHLKAGAKLYAGGARSLLHRDVAVVAHGKDLA